MIDVGVLQSSLVRLEPLARSHVDALTAAATDEGRASFALAPVPRDRPEMEDSVERALDDQAANRAVPFALVDCRGGGARVVGSVRLMSLEWWWWPPGPITVDGEPRAPDDFPDVAEIGHAWLAPSAQRTGANSSAWFLLMRHAFEVWRVHRLVLKTDARNQRSRSAIERAGARFEGILRAHLPAADGIVRDTAMFSVVRAEWPELRKRLESALGSPHNS